MQGDARGVGTLRPEIAIEKLQELKAEAGDPNTLYRNPEGSASCKSRVRSVVARSLGEHHDLVGKLDSNKYGLMMATDRTPDSAWAGAFAKGVRKACGYIDAAVYELELLTDSEDPTGWHSIDPELWAHVKGLVENEDWNKVAASVSTFVETKVRTWAGLDGSRYGKRLFAEALGDAGALRLGATSGEHEGWRALATGFAQAISNVDRHHIQDRQDARRYAIGVLGLGSLLLTQLRFEHGDLAASTPVEFASP